MRCFDLEDLCQSRNRNNKDDHHKCWAYHETTLLYTVPTYFTDEGPGSTQYVKTSHADVLHIKLSCSPLHLLREGQRWCEWQKQWLPWLHQIWSGLPSPALQLGWWGQICQPGRLPIVWRGRGEGGGRREGGRREGERREGRRREREERIREKRWTE